MRGNGLPATFPPSQDGYVGFNTESWPLSSSPWPAKPVRKKWLGDPGRHDLLLQTRRRHPGLETGDEKDDGWLMWGANADHNGRGQ
jgi:hypothetical protein